MSGKSIEYTVGIDSFNRDSSVWPNTSDFEIDLVRRYECYQVVLTSLELPSAQYLIEAPWSKLDFDLGLETPLMADPLVAPPVSPPSVAYRTIKYRTFNDGPPPTFTPVPQVTTATVLPAPFLHGTAQAGDQVVLDEPHGLTMSALQQVPSMQAFVHAENDPSRAKNFVTGVVDATTLLVADPIAPAGTEVVLVVSGAGPNSFASAIDLAKFMNANLVASGFDISLEYDVCRCSARLVVPSPPAPVGPRQVYWPAGSDAYLVDEFALLFVFLGFIAVSGEVPLAAFPLRVPAFPVRRYAGNIRPGNYDITNLKAQLESTLNPQTVVGNVSNGGFKVLYDAAETTVTVGTLGSPGLAFADPAYHPDLLAKNIQTLISNAYGGAPPVRLTWVEETNSFVFTSVGAPTPLPFTIHWNSSAIPGVAPPPGDQQIASALGFDPTVVQMESLQLVGASRGFFDMPMAVTLPFSVGNDSINSVRKLFFSVRQRGPPKLTFEITRDSPTEITCELGIAPLGVLYIGPIKAAAGGAPTGKYACVFTHTQDLPNHTTRCLLVYPQTSADFAVGDKADVMPVLYQTAGLNFYLTPPGNSPAITTPPPSKEYLRSEREQTKATFSRLAQILGFSDGCYSLGGGELMMKQAPLDAVPGFLVPPFCFDLEHPGYVLVDIGLDHFSATFSHRAGNDDKTMLMGKVVLFTPNRYERTAGISRMATGISVFTKLRIRLYNPWHGLFDLHGRNWSMTLVFGSTMVPVRAEMP
jgi:hypothetical protein